MTKDIVKHNTETCWQLVGFNSEHGQGKKKGEPRNATVFPEFLRAYPKACFAEEQH